MSLEPRDRYDEILDNYLLFIHNMQLQQNSMTLINNTIHNALYNILQTNFVSGSEHRVRDEEDVYTMGRFPHRNVNTTREHRNLSRSSPPSRLNPIPNRTRLTRDENMMKNQQVLTLTKDNINQYN